MPGWLIFLIVVAIVVLLLFLRGSGRIGGGSTRPPGPPGIKHPGEIRGAHKGFGSGPGGI